MWDLISGVGGDGGSGAILQYIVHDNVVDFLLLVCLHAILPK